MHLLRKLFESSGRAEDAATEIFAECLRHKCFLDVFLRDVVGALVPDDAAIWTQVPNVHARGVPDVVIESPCRKLRVVVENKLGAGLSDNQPAEYLKDLDAHPVQFGWLVFQCPETRLKSVDSEIRNRLTKPDDARVKVVSWERTLHAFAAVTPIDPVAGYLRDGLRSTIGPEIQYVPPDPVSEDESIMLSSREFANAAVHLSRLLPKVQDHLRENGWSTSAIASEAPNFDSIGFYIDDERHWFGCFWRATAAHGDGPLWLQSGSLDLEAAIRAAGHPTFPGGVFDGWGGNLVPVRPPQAKDIDEQARAIAGHVNQLLRLMSPRSP